MVCVHLDSAQVPSLVGVVLMQVVLVEVVLMLSWWRCPWWRCLWWRWHWWRRLIFISIIRRWTKWWSSRSSRWWSSRSSKWWSSRRWFGKILVWVGSIWTVWHQERGTRWWKPLLSFWSLINFSDSPFLQNLPFNYQLPSYSLLFAVLMFTHNLLSLSSLLLRKECLQFGKKESARYLRISRGCLQGQKKRKGINHVSYASSYILGSDITCLLWLQVSSVKSVCGTLWL